MNDYITPTGLRLEGWTNGLIERFLGDPDKTAPNPKYRSAAASMRLYLRSRVADITAQPKVQNALNEARAKRHGRKHAALKAVQTKTENAVSQMHEGIETEVAELLANTTPGRLIQDACEHYNNGGGIPDWAYEKRDWAWNRQRAGGNSDFSFLCRIAANYVRHCCTSYESRLCGYIGTQKARTEAHRVVNRLVRKFLAADTTTHFRLKETTMAETAQSA